jgi:hypothetical protein
VANPIGVYKQRNHREDIQPPITIGLRLTDNFAKASGNQRLTLRLKSRRDDHIEKPGTASPVKGLAPKGAGLSASCRYTDPLASTMSFPGARPPANNIVEEYLSPDDGDFIPDFQTFKGLSDEEKVDVIAREAEEHGLEKPQGWNVSFHYNPHVEYHHFGSSHPMKPWRLTLTKQLVLSYGLEYTMDLYTPRPANFGELALFHDREYLSYLSK